MIYFLHYLRVTNPIDQVVGIILFYIDFVIGKQPEEKLGRNGKDRQRGRGGRGRSRRFLGTLEVDTGKSWKCV